MRCTFPLWFIIWTTATQVYLVDGFFTSTPVSVFSRKFACSASRQTENDDYYDTYYPEHSSDEELELRSLTERSEAPIQRRTEVKDVRDDDFLEPGRRDDGYLARPRKTNGKTKRSEREDETMEWEDEDEDEESMPTGNYWSNPKSDREIAVDRRRPPPRKSSTRPSMDQRPARRRR